MQFWVLRSQEAWSSESKLSPINNSLQTSIGDIIISKCDIIVSKFVDMHEVRGRGGAQAEDFENTLMQKFYPVRQFIGRAFEAVNPSVPT